MTAILARDAPHAPWDHARMDGSAARRWIDRYESAWRAADPGPLLRALFTEDATYSTEPFAEPRRGLAEIGVMWEAEREGPDEEFAMTHDLVAVDGPVFVARVDVLYGPPSNQRYRDLWVVELADDGRCAHFEEWPFWPEGTAGSTASRPAS
jgi:hypothetical protein